MHPGACVCVCGGCVPLFLSANKKNRPPPAPGHGNDADKLKQSCFFAVNNQSSCQISSFHQ